MCKMIRVSVLCILVFHFYNAGVTAAKWNYRDLDQWPKQCHVGKSQSPINLSPDIAEGKTFPPFQFDGYDEIYPSIVQNNGHTIQLRLNVNKKPTVSGGGLLGHYTLDSLHFHWASEHTVGDRRFPLELHLVHYDSRYKDLSQALLVGRAAVLSVLFYESSDDDSEFSSLYNLLGTKRMIVNTPELNQIELDDFLPRDRAGFYRYNGSLTTPDCKEGVLWTVFTNGLPISSRQIKIFSNLYDDENQRMESNYRPLQELNDRRIYLKVSDMESSGNFISASKSLKMFVFAVVLKLLM